MIDTPAHVITVEPGFDRDDGFAVEWRNIKSAVFVRFKSFGGRLSHASVTTAPRYRTAGPPYSKFSSFRAQPSS